MKSKVVDNVIAAMKSETPIVFQVACGRSWQRSLRQRGKPKNVHVQDPVRVGCGRACHFRQALPPVYSCLGEVSLRC